MLFVIYFSIITFYENDNINQQTLEVFMYMYIGIHECWHMCVCVHSFKRLKELLFLTKKWRILQEKRSKKKVYFV